MPYDGAMLQRESRWTPSNPFVKSTKVIERRCWYSKLCSMMMHKMKICSMHDQPLRNPACSSRSFWSTALWSLWRRTKLNTLPGTERSVIPCQLLQSGTHINDQHELKRSVISLKRHCLPCLSISAETMSKPGTLPFLRNLIAATVSSVIMAPALTSKSLAWLGVLKTNELSRGTDSRSL